MCNKISDAIDHLNPENIKDVNLEYPGQTELDKEQANDPEKDAEESKRNLQNWCPNKLGTARAVLQYNLAVAFATRGELDKAGETLKRVFAARGPECEVPTHVVMLALYLELQLGKHNLNLLKKRLFKSCWFLMVLFSIIILQVTQMFQGALSDSTARSTSEAETSVCEKFKTI